MLHIRSLSGVSRAYKDNLFKNKRISRAKSARKFIENEILEILESYNKSNPDTSKFLPYVEKAIERAEELDENQNDDLLHKLETRVYKLAQSILKLRNIN